jgi:beta-galactosidase
MPGQTIDLWAYYNNADEVELFVNGKSQGVRRKTTEQPAKRYEMHNLTTSLNTEYHVGWRVTFEPGEVKAVSRKDGKTVCEQVIRTAGQPDHLRLTIDYSGYQQNSKSTSPSHLTFVKVEVVDRDGNLCPWAENQVLFSALGDNTCIVATDNGYQTSLERFTSPQRKAFFGKCMVVVKGRGTVKAQAIGLKEGTLRL